MDLVQQSQRCKEKLLKRLIGIKDMWPQRLAGSLMVLGHCKLNSLENEAPKNVRLISGLDNFYFNNQEF